MKKLWHVGILAIVEVVLFAACSPSIPPDEIDVSLNATNIGIITGIPFIKFGQYSAELTDGTYWEYSSSGSSGVYDINVTSGTYDVAVSIASAGQPVPSMCSLTVYTGGITGGGGTPIVTGSPGAFVVTFAGISVPSGGGGITISLD